MNEFHDDASGMIIIQDIERIERRPAAQFRNSVLNAALICAVIAALTVALSILYYRAY